MYVYHYFSSPFSDYIKIQYFIFECKKIQNNCIKIVINKKYFGAMNISTLYSMKNAKLCSCDKFL